MSKAIIDFEKGDISALKEISDALQTIIDKEGAIGEQWKVVLAAMNSNNATAATSTAKVAQSIDKVAQEQKDLATQTTTTGAAIENQNKSNTASANKLSESIDKVGQSQKQVADQTKATQASVDNQNKANIQSTNKLAQSIDQLAVASKSMDKVVIGGAYKNYLTQIQQTLGLTNNEIIAYVQNARKAAQAEILNPANTKQKIDELTVSIDVMNKTLLDMGVNEDGTTEKTISLRAQLRNMRDELAAMAEAGLKGTPAFDDLKEKAGSLQNEMDDLNETIRNTGSDTRNIDGLISVVTGVAGVYAAAEGAAALFGNENEDVAKALLKVQAAMSILTGLQEVANVLTEKSSANIFLNTLFRKNQAAAITQTNAAEGTNIGLTETQTVKTALQTTATEGATVAQKGLNLAMLASPVGILILSVGTLVGLYQIFSERSKEATEAQQNLNKVIEFAIELNNQYVAAIGQANDLLLAQAKNRGAQEKEIRDIETNTLKEQLAQTLAVEKSKQDAYKKSADFLRSVSEGRIKFNSDEVKANQQTVTDFEQIQQKRFDLEQQLEIKQVNDNSAANKEKFQDFQDYQNARVAAATAGTDQERQLEIEAIRAIAKERETQADFLSKSDAEKALIRLNDDKQIQALQLQNYQHYLKGRTASVDAELAIQKAHQATSDADQIASINRITDLQIASIKKQRDEQLSNPTLNSGERQKAIEEANAAIVEAEKKKQQDILAVQKNELTLQLAATQKESYDEYVYNLALIENERQAEVAAAGKNKDLIAAIDAKYRKEKQDADIAFNVVQLNNEISRDNAALARFGISEQDKLELTLKRLEDEKAVEIAQANGNAAKIAEIDAKYIQQTREAKIASIDAVKNKEIEAYQAYHDEVMKVDQRIADDALLNVNLRVSALEDLKREQDQELQIEINALEKKKGLIEDYDVQYQLLQNKKRDIAQNIEKQITQIEKQEIDKRVAQMQSLVDFFKNGFQNILPQNAFSVGLSSLTDFGNSAFKIFANLKQQVSDFNKIIFDPSSSSADVLQAAADKRIAQTQAIQQAEIAATQAAQNIVNQIYADGSAQRQQQLQEDLQALQDERAKELENTNLTKSQQAEINKRFDQKEKQTKLAAWKADQQAKKESAIINGLLALTRTYAEYGFTPAGWIAAAAQVAATGIIVAEISSQKPPKFRHGQVDINPKDYKSYTGKINISGPGTKTSDSIPAMISKGETVIAADPTAKWKEALVAINNDHFEDYLSQKFKSFVFPHIPDDVPIPTGRPVQIDYDRLKIDYELLASTMADKIKGVIPAPKSTHVNIDKDGIHTITQEGNTRTEWKNRRYSMS